VQYLKDTNDETTPKKIVTVTTLAPESLSGENYNYYYPTYCLLYLDNNVQNSNTFVRIYHEQIVVRRRYTTDLTDSTLKIKTQLIFKVTGGTELSTITTNRYVKLERYASMSDDIKHDKDKDYKVTIPSS
jgi:hypothetical protein